MLYAEALRHALEAYRELGLTFDTAWAYATADHPRPEDPSEPATSWLKRHFRAAYEDDSSRLGRFPVAERDTSEAIKPIQLGPSATSALPVGRLPRALAAAA